MYFNLIEKISKNEYSRNEIETLKKELTEKLFSNNDCTANHKAQA